MTFFKIIVLFHCAMSLGLINAGCSKSDHDEEKIIEAVQPQKLKVLVVGIDGMEPSLIDSFIKKGMMPNFQRIVDGGRKSVIMTDDRLSSPVIWTTIATGVSPNAHGIENFTTSDGKPPNSTYRKVPAFWNIMYLNNVKAATLAWWLTWPAEKDAGIMIGDRVYWKERPDKVYPPGIIDTDKYAFDNFINNIDFIKRFSSFDYQPDYKDKYAGGGSDYIKNHLFRQRLIRTYIRDTVYKNIALELAENEKPEVMAVYFQGLDHTQHAFWQYMEPGPFRESGIRVDEDDIKEFGNIIPEYHRYLDEILGELLTACDNDTYIFLLADHGFHADPELVKDEPGLGLSGNHLPETIFVLSGPEVTKENKTNSKIAQRQVDFLPTLLYMLDLPLAQDFEGRPLKEYFSDKYNDKKKIKKIDTYRGKYKKKSVISSNQDGKVLEDLRGLGYIK